MPENSETSVPKTALPVVAAVLACLVLGGLATYWLASDSPAPPPVSARPVQGKLLTASSGNAPKLTPAAKTIPPAATGDAEYMPLGFETLSGYYYPSLEIDPEQSIKGAAHDILRPEIPPVIRALDGKKAAVQGYMVPLKQERGACTLFYLVRDQNICCFRRTPSMNELVTVKMPKGARYVQNQFVTVFGTIHIGEETENGALISIYRMDADELAGPMN